MDAKGVDNCSCTKIVGHLEAVKWLLWPRNYRPSPGYLHLGDWCTNPFIWMHCTESGDGILAGDDVLMSSDDRYWSIHDVQRYFCCDLHCERVLFTCQYPNLRMPSRLGSYLWKSNTALKLPSTEYLKEFHRSLEVTLKKIEAEQVQMDRIILSDQLIKIDCLDCFKRKTFFRVLMNIISFQDSLEVVAFENLCCKRLEGVQLIQQLASFNSHSLKYLFLWRFVLPNENPIIINYSYITGSGQHIPRPSSRDCFLQSLGSLRNLRVLALEYSHIADSTGGALITLLPILKLPHFRLQLICREDQTPGKVDPSLGVGGDGIPDTAWRRVAISCPNLYIFMVFFRIRDYDNVRRFLSPSIPMKEIHLQLGIDLKQSQRQDSDLNSFVRHVAHFYSCGLVAFSVHQWRFATFPLHRVIELMPRLGRLFYIGCVASEADLRKMLFIISSGVCDKLRQVDIRVQDEESKREYWMNTVNNLSEEFKDIFELFNINICFNIYRS